MSDVELKPPKRPKASALQDTSTGKKYLNWNSASQQKFKLDEATYHRKVVENLKRDLKKARNSAERVAAHEREIDAYRLNWDRENQPHRVKTLYAHKLQEIQQPLIQAIFFSRGYDHLHTPTYLGKPADIGKKRIRLAVDVFESKLIPLYLRYGWYHVQLNIDPTKCEWFKDRRDTVRGEMLKRLDTLHGATDFTRAAQTCIELFELLCSHLHELADIFECHLLPQRRYQREAEQIRTAAQEALTQLQRTINPSKREL